VWQKACEKYFRLFAVSDSQWVEYATLHFTGNVATWLQTVDDQLPTFTWGKLCDLIDNFFLIEVNISYCIGKILSLGKLERLLPM
jgi:hypothetical protein